MDAAFTTSFLFQVETEKEAGFYCHARYSFLESSWYSINMFATFALLFVIPFSLIVHNYARIGVTLFKNLKENVHLQEGINTQ